MCPGTIGSTLLPRDFAGVHARQERARMPAGVPVERRAAAADDAYRCAGRHGVTPGDDDCKLG